MVLACKQEVARSHATTPPRILSGRYGIPENKPGNQANGGITDVLEQDWLDRRTTAYGPDLR